MRAERIRAALEAAGAPVVPAAAQPDAALHAVHDPALTDYLAGAWAAWSASSFPQDPGQDRVVPYVFPHGSVPARAPAADPRARGPLRLRHDDADRAGHVGGGARRDRRRGHGRRAGRTAAGRSPTR